MSLSLTRVTIKTPLVRQAKEDHLKESTSLERTWSPDSGFCSARNHMLRGRYSLLHKSRSFCMCSYFPVKRPGSVSFISAKVGFECVIQAQPK